MCRDTISVNWVGEVFDCDFNQMLKLPTYKNNRTLRFGILIPKSFKIRQSEHSHIVLDVPLVPAVRAAALS